MSKNLSPKQSFLLLYISTIAFVVTVYLLSMLAMMGEVRELPDSLWSSFVRFLWPFGIPLILIAIFFVVVAIPRARIALARLEIPGKYSPKHFLLLLWLTVQAFLLGVALHGAIYALGIFAFGADFWAAGDEPVFFTIALVVVPAGFIAGTVGRLWQWAMVQPIDEMKARGIQLPSTWPYFAPIGSYVWLWKFAKGVETITERRIRAGGVLLPSFSWALLASLLSGLLSAVA